MKKNVLILSILLGLGFCYSAINAVKLNCNKQRPEVISPANLLAEEQKPIVFTIKV